MKVLQILLDSYYPILEGNMPEILDKSILRSRFSNVDIVTSEDTSTTKLLSPNMWKRTLAGASNSTYDVPRYNPNQTDASAVVSQGYSNIPVEDWIWNKLASKGVNSFSMPYYLVKQLPTESVVDNTLATVYCKDYSTKEYRLVNKGTSSVGASPNVYSCLCTRFDKGLDKVERVNFGELWDKGDEDSMITMVDYVKSKIVPKLYEDLVTNKTIFEEELFRLLSYSVATRDSDDYYTFVGLSEPDAVNHFTHPYTKFNEVFRDEYVSYVVNRLIDTVNPDVLIIHGDHNMKSTYRPRMKVKSKFTYEGIEYGTGRAQNSMVPFYTDHGNKVGGVVCYTDEVKSQVKSLLANKSGLLVDRVYYWLIESLSN